MEGSVCVCMCMCVCVANQISGSIDLRKFVKKTAKGLYFTLDACGTLYSNITAKTQDLDIFITGVGSEGVGVGRGGVDTGK